MYISLSLIGIIILLVCGSFIWPVRLFFFVHADRDELCLSVCWRSALRVKTSLHRTGMQTAVSILRWEKRREKPKKARKKRGSVLKSLALTDTKIQADYGFPDPGLTGILYVLINMAAVLLPGVRLEQNPEFIARRAGFRIRGTTKVNVGKTAVNYFRALKNKKGGGRGMEQQNLTDNVNFLFQSLEDFTQREGIIGKPVTQGDKTFLPIVSITVGYGGGNASLGKGQQGQMPGTAGAGTGTGALGLGAKLCTDAVLVIDNQNVTMLPVGSAASSLADKIPQIISSMNQNKNSGTPAQ